MSAHFVPSWFLPLALKDIPDPPEIRRHRAAYQRHLERTRRRRQQAEEQREMLLQVLEAMGSVLEDAR